MSNKQGFFSRGDSNASPESTTNPSDKAGSSTLMPGHLAALASTTPATGTTTAPSASPSLTSSSPLSSTTFKNDSRLGSPKVDSSSGSRLIVGPDVKLKGAEILDCDTLVVEGRVEATMDSRVIQIASDGSFSGKVGIDVAEIHGKFDGELTARSQLIIHSTGVVSGKIRYGKIFIEEGGELSGDVASLSSESRKSSI